MNIISINEDSSYLDKVKVLWRKNSGTLGRFPDGAFIAYAKAGHILVMLDDKHDLAGYLIYRISYSRVTIVHLCVSPYLRGAGLAQQLVQHLREKTKHLDGIGLKCRRDFPAYSIWQRMGFVAQYDTPGRGIERKELTYFWFDYGHQNLFTDQLQPDAYKIAVVIDANVFIDLLQEPDDIILESHGLLADWVQDNLDLYLTDEIRNDINRQQDKKRLNELRLFTDQFKIVNCSPDITDEIYKTLRSLYPCTINERDRSDLFHLSKTIASGIHFFVTRDEQMLSFYEQVYEMYGVSILGPSDIIIHLDELIREEEYQPSKLAGTSIISRRIQSNEQKQFAREFQCVNEGEKVAELIGQLRQYSSQPNLYISSVVLLGKEPVTLIAYARPNSQTLELPLIRAGKSSLSPTVIRNLILQSIIMSANEGRYFTKISDKYLSPTVLSALNEYGFFKISDYFFKINLNLANNAKDLAYFLRTIMPCVSEQERFFFAQFAEQLELSHTEENINNLAKLEKLMWPAKILDANIPSFMVPIRPQWAEQLFDAGLAEQNLFGVDPFLALNVESVFYRSKLNARGISAPARILWYITGNRSYYQTQCIRACSILDEVVINKPGPIFKRFRRLGVYQWQDLYNLAKSDVECDIMALKFSHTELFSAPLTLKIIRKAFDDFNIKVPLRSPIPLPNELFARLYLQGMDKAQGSI